MNKGENWFLTVVLLSGIIGIFSSSQTQGENRKGKFEVTGFPSSHLLILLTK